MTEGCQIPLMYIPNRCFPPSLSTEDTTILQDKIQSLLQKQAISQIPTPVRGFYSNMFIVPQKDGGQGPVNRYMKSRWKASGGPRVEEPEGEGPSEPPGNSNAPRWCKYGRCGEIPTPVENVCYNSRPCITTKDMFDNIVLNSGCGNCSSCGCV